MAEGPRVRMTGRGAAIAVGLIIGGLVVVGIADAANVEALGGLATLMWAAAALGIGIAAWLTQFEVVDPDQ